MPGGSFEAAFARGFFRHPRRLRFDGCLFQSFEAIAGIAPGYRPPMSFQPPLRRVEGLVQCRVKVFVVVMRDHDFAARHLDVQAHDEFLALLLVPGRNLHHDAAADDVAVEMLELRDAPADRGLDGLGLGDVAQRDLQWDLHQWSSVRGMDSSAGWPVSGSIHSEMPISLSASASVSPGSYAVSSADLISAAASASVGKGPYSVPRSSACQ